MKNKSLILLIVSLFLVSNAFAQTADPSKRYFEINKNLEVFNSVLKELDMFYVDTVNVEKTVQTGIVNMLAGLDPYTNYITEDGMKEFKIMTTGEYAGVGSYITAREYNGKVAVMLSEPYEGMPADKAGLKSGDVILEINGEDMTSSGKLADVGADLSTKVSSLLKGQAGTEVKLKIARYGEKKPLDKKIVRENIQMSSVPYSGVIANTTIGYIILTGFTDKCAQDVKTAFLDLKKQGITALILDLRGNGGGILEEAVQIVNLFTPKGEVVLSTKGKMKQTDRTYRTTLAPIDTEIPLIVLADRGSASASEITAGAIQDLDRGVIVGERTFGKGLVQVTREIPYGGGLKVTTSKYYTPSGRCVQAIDYAHRNDDGSVGRIPDSLTTVFKTAIGREVRDGGGIIPDISVDPEKTPSIIYYLVRDLIISDFVTEWAYKHSKIDTPENFVFTDADYDAFVEFVKSKKDFKYGGLSEKSMASLKEMMEYEGYNESASDEFKALEAKLVPDLDRDLVTFKDDIRKFISIDIARRYYYKRGETIESLKYDGEVKKAIEVINNTEEYKEILTTPGRKIEVKDSKEVALNQMSIKHYIELTQYVS